MGRERNFIASKHFYYGVNTATCTVKEYQHDYKLKHGSNVHATLLVGHLKREHPNLYSKASNKKGNKKPKASNITSWFESQSEGISSATVGKQLPTMLKFPITSQVSKIWQLKLSAPMVFLLAPSKNPASQRCLLRC